MRRSRSDEEHLAAHLEALIKSTHNSKHETYLRYRWLDQIKWMEKRANASRNYHYALRSTTIVAGVIVPALVGFERNVSAGSLTRDIAIVLSVLVAMSAAIEEFFHFGERWRHYRQTAERLKAEGWYFTQSTGPYGRKKSTAAKRIDPFKLFVLRVENIIRWDVEEYMRSIAAEHAEPDEDDEEPGEDAEEPGEYEEHEQEEEGRLEERVEPPPIDAPAEPSRKQPAGAGGEP
jgi:hypothetical protein